VQAGLIVQLTRTHEEHRMRGLSHSCVTGTPPMPEIVADMPESVLLSPAFHNRNRGISITWS
jgi:hypothetical protein